MLGLVGFLLPFFLLFFFCPHLVPSCVLPIYFLEPLGSFLINILLFIDKKNGLHEVGGGGGGAVFLHPGYLLCTLEGLSDQFSFYCTLSLGMICYLFRNSIELE